MATSKKGYNLLPIVVGIAGFLPFFLVFFFSYQKIKITYITSSTAIRVIDIKHCVPFFIMCGGVMLISLLAILFLLVVTKLFWLQVFVSANFALLWIIGGTLATKQLAVRCLGLIADKECDYVVLPFEMKSYSILNYITFQFVEDFCNVDIITLSKITSLTPGQGSELYLHGKFGSRAAIFSSKQKRDEVLAIIKELNSDNTKMMSEIESY